MKKAPGGGFDRSLIECAGQEKSMEAEATYTCRACGAESADPGRRRFCAPCGMFGFELAGLDTLTASELPATPEHQDAERAPRKRRPSGTFRVAAP